jgi:hypothetical protein
MPAQKNEPDEDELLVVDELLETLIEPEPPPYEA